MAVKSVWCKFSGNKDFHIGAFAKSVGDKEIREIFPYDWRKVTEFLVNYMSDKHTFIDGDVVSFGGFIIILLMV